MVFNVSLEGNFVTEMKIEASSPRDAEKAARDKLDKLINLSQEDYVIDLVSVGKENGPN